MRHRVRGRHLGRNPSHRKAMFRNMAASLIRSIRVDDEDSKAPRVAGRIVTTTAKAKELRPFVEKLVTIARKSAPLQQKADDLKIAAEKNSEEWRNWRQSEDWQQWNQAQAPVLAMRRRAFSMLRDNEAVDILFDELAERFIDRPGGYTRIVRLAKRRLGDNGEQALIEFVGVRDRVSQKSAPAPVVVEEEEEQVTETDEAAAEAEEADTEEAPQLEAEEGGEEASAEPAEESDEEEKAE